MTVRELIAALQALPPEAQDYPVFRAHDEWPAERVETDWKWSDMDNESGERIHFARIAGGI